MAKEIEKDNNLKIKIDEETKRQKEEMRKQK